MRVLCSVALCAWAAQALVVRPTFRSAAPAPHRETARRPVEPRAAGRGKTALSASETAPEFFGPSRPLVRTASVAALWLGLIGYVALGAPGKDEAAQALDSELLSKLIADPFSSDAPRLFVVVFNLMGVWPAVYASLLLPGTRDQKPVPALPFLAGAVAFGMFALSPYLALRERRTEGCVKPTGLAGRWFESKINAAVLMLSTIGLLGFGLTAPDLGAAVADYKALFDAQLFVHVTTLDFMALWALSFAVVKEDMERRPESSLDPNLAPALAAVPILGPLAWMLIRPPLPDAPDQ